MSASIIKSVTTFTRGPIADRFTPAELKLIDIDGLQRDYLKITISKYTEDVYDMLRDIAKVQYALPVRYLKPSPGSYQYVSQKSQLSGNEKDIRNASLVIEPLNPDIFHVISYTPINQSIPLGTVVTIDVTTDFNTLPDGQEPERRFIWSDNLIAPPDIEKKIKAAKPSSKTTRPWIGKCHYCAIDVGSHLTAKFEVSNVDLSIIKSFALYGFARSDDDNEFVLWTYRCYNVTPTEILGMIRDHEWTAETSKRLIDEVIKKAPK